MAAKVPRGHSFRNPSFRLVTFVVWLFHSQKALTIEPVYENSYKYDNSTVIQMKATVKYSVPLLVIGWLLFLPSLRMEPAYIVTIFGYQPVSINVQDNYRAPPLP